MSDAQLLDRVRAGDASAYATLWLRHKQAGLYAARAFSNSLEAEDVVAEAHSRIFKALREGKGPNSHFRPYLITTIRNIMRRWGQTQNDTTVTNYDELVDAEATGEFTDSSLEKLTLRQAFESLPERWQSVLWNAEVVGASHQELAKSLGLRRSAATVLLYRAREGLKQAWIDAHLPQSSSDPECMYTISQLGAYERKALSKPAHARVATHLTQCSSCSSVQIDANRVAQTLKSALLPTMLVGAAVAGTTNTTMAATPAAAAPSAASASPVGILSKVALLASPKAAMVALTSIVVFAGVASVAGVAATQAQEASPRQTSPADANQSGDEADSDASDGLASGSSPAGAATSISETDDSATIPGQSIPLFTFLGPAAPHFHAADGAILNGPVLEITGSALPEATVTLFLSSNRSGYRTETVTANQAGGWTAQFPNSAEGDYVVRAYQINAREQRSALRSISYSVEWTAPGPAPVVTSVDTAQGTLAPLVSGTGDPGNTVQVLLNGIATTQRISRDGSWAVQANKGALLGTNEITVSQYSPLTKRASLSTAPFTFQLQAPDASFIPGPPGTLAITVISQAERSIQIRDVDGGFSHTLLSSSGSDTLELAWENTGGLGSSAAVELRYTAEGGKRLGPVAIVTAGG